MIARWVCQEAGPGAFSIKDGWPNAVSHRTALQAVPLAANARIRPGYFSKLPNCTCLRLTLKIDRATPIPPGVWIVNLSPSSIKRVQSRRTKKEASQADKNRPSSSVGEIAGRLLSMLWRNSLTSARNAYNSRGRSTWKLIAFVVYAIRSMSFGR